MISLHFEINGRRVDPAHMGDALEAAMLSAIANEIQRRVGSCRCAEHGESPKLIGKGKGVETLNFEIEGCCEKLIEDARRKFGG